MDDRDERDGREDEPEAPARPKKHLLYRIFNSEGKGKDALPEPEGPFNLARCFRTYKRNITNLLYINLLIIFGNFPLIFGVYGLTGALNGTTTAAASELFGPLHGAMLHSTSPASLALFGVHGFQTSQQVLSTATIVFLLLSLLVIFTFGIINTGTAYLLRSIVRRDPMFFWSDFKGAIKRNFRQAFVIGIIDALISFLLIYDFYFFYINQSAMFYVMIAVFAIYNMMRYYIYPLLVTFDLSIWKIFKNAMIFAILGFRRNILAFLASALLITLEYFLLGIFYPLGVILPLVVFFSSCAYFGMFAAWPKIKEIMIDPYVEEEK